MVRSIGGCVVAQRLRMEPPSDIQPQRRFEREPVSSFVTGSATGFAPLIIQLLDVSASGFRAIIHPHIRPGTQLTVSLTRIAERTARVIWTTEDACGCEFAEPLRPNDVVVF